MTPFEAIILGLIQGLTEFLPVSSSGHLALGQHFLGLKNLKSYVLFDLVCHLGTLLAVLLLFWSEIRKILLIERQRLLQIAVGTFPLFPLVLLIKPIKDIFDRLDLLGYFFLTTALLLFLGIRFGKTKMERARFRYWTDPLVIGLFQAMAILPGVSRSGSTISGARLLGWSPSESVTFSFLLAIPAILGGSLLETIKLFSGHEKTASLNIDPIVYAIGFIVSFIVGFGALKLLIRLVVTNKLGIFAWYCLALGILCLYLFSRT